MPVPSHLHKQLLKALPLSHYFRSDEALRSLFVREELFPWRHTLPDADGTELRAAQILDLLAEQFTSKNENVLILLLYTLAEITPSGDALRSRFISLADALVQAYRVPPLPAEVDPVEIDPAPPRPGLIVTVSPGPSRPDTPSAAESAIQHHTAAGETLRHCWLLAGPGIGDVSSAANAFKLHQWLNARNIATETWQLASADDIEELFRKMQTIIQVARHRYGLLPTDVVADYTGGTKSMTTAMVLAAQATGIHLQYMKPNRYLENGYADRLAGSRAVQVDIPFVRVTAIELEEDDRH